MQRNLLAQSQFVLHMFTLMSGDTLAQVITAGTSPILMRTYHQEDFGVFAVISPLHS